ncbi:MAG: phosphoesterase RecJ domain-containing protein [Ruminococcaceae bacterium]|nr:phosphoesterase RecJ domain-containing protein [Oscillospiraceae bacterium]
MKGITVNRCAEILREHDDYLILSHKFPDGDTLGSGAALCSALRRIGKTAYCFPNPDITPRYAGFIEPYLAKEGQMPSFAISVDIASDGMLSSGAPQDIKLAIDHHKTNTGFAKDLCLDYGKSSCGELVLEIIEALCGSISEEEANLLYIAVSTDTGCFQYTNTNAGTLEAAAKLVKAGADNKSLNVMLFRTLSRARITLLGMLYSGMKYYKSGKVTAATVTLEMLNSIGATEDDCEDIAGIPGAAEGAAVSVLIRELGENYCKVSLRSKPGYDVSKVCAVFGGGGHPGASGCKIKHSPEETEKMILSEISKQWPKL